jgi:hypothetical protein
MLTLDECRRAIGRKVAYRAHGLPPEEGEIVRVTDSYVFVHYGTDAQAKATQPEDLEAVGWKP